jgi:hypothetical protein
MNIFYVLPNRVYKGRLQYLKVLKAILIILVIFVTKRTNVKAQYRKDRLKFSVFLSLSLCKKWSILFGQGNSTQAVFKGMPS